MALQALMFTVGNTRSGWRCEIESVADIANGIRADDVASLSAGCYDFWVTSSLEPFHRRTNVLATKIFYRANEFSARQTPLLSGVVVITGRGVDGQLVGLTDEEIQAFVESAYEPGLWMCQIEWRLWRSSRREKQRRRVGRRRVSRLRHFAF